MNSTRFEQSKNQESTMFTLEHDSDWGYEHQVGIVNVSPRRMKEVFGEPIPNPGEPEKITGEYIFLAPSEERYSVHDWRDTDLSEGDDAPSPEEFWNIKEPYELSIGGDEPIDAEKLKMFKEWLVKQLS